jgi:hypothetical protein
MWKMVQAQYKFSRKQTVSTAAREENFFDHEEYESFSFVFGFARTFVQGTCCGVRGLSLSPAGFRLLHRAGCLLVLYHSNSCSDFKANLEIRGR